MDNNKNYSQVEIDELDLSVRSYNCLKRARIDNVQSLIEAYKSQNLLEIKNLGVGSLNEIERKLLSYISEEHRDMIEQDKSSISEEIEKMPIKELDLSVRLFNVFSRNNILTVGQIVELKPAEIRSLRGIGAVTQEELNKLIESIRKGETKYFIKKDRSNLIVDEKNKRTIDIDTVHKLKEEYHFKPAWLLDWYGITRSRIQQILTKNKNKGNWLNREFTEENKSILLEMIDKNQDEYVTTFGENAYLLNNRTDDFAAIFVSEDEIKCFFLNDLPLEVQEIIVSKRLDCLTFDEIELSKSGRIVSILKKEYFSPDNINKFRQFAAYRKMSVDDYCFFLTGLTTPHAMIDDTKIMDFLRTYYINGKIMIPSNNSTHWFRSFISRNGYTLDEISELYGFNDSKNTLGGDLLSEEIEDDMIEYDSSSEEWVDRIYAQNPLIGNYILKESEKEKLNVLTKQFIDKRLQDSQYKLSLNEKKLITLAIVNYTKEWDLDDESGFWRFVTSQFGYRDETNLLRGILSECIMESIAKSNRWFLSGLNGYQYKATIAVHALTTRRSWCLFFDFLFDFYKTNMEWTFIEGDSIITRMVFALRNKLLAGKELDEGNISISTKVYYLQEGIQKLVIYRTGYAIKLINHIIKRIDGILNHTELVTSIYLDELIDYWFEKKLNQTGNRNVITRREKNRNIAIDYSRIRPVYVLRNETDAYISFPDIRILKTSFEKIELVVYASDIDIETRSLRFYGNELGKTVENFDVDIKTCLRRGDGTFHIRILIKCDGEVIFDSKDTLYRENLCFANGKEYKIQDCQKGLYTFITTKDNVFDFSNSEVSDIEEDNYMHSFLVRLDDSFLVTFNDRIISFDDAGEKGENAGIRVIKPQAHYGTVYYKNGYKYSVVSEDAKIKIIVNSNFDSRKVSLKMNEKLIDFGKYERQETISGNIYIIPINTENGICEYQVYDLERNRIILQDSIKVIPFFKVNFNREFYYGLEDYKEAYVDVFFIHGRERYQINYSDRIASFSFEEGTLEINIPKIDIRNSMGEKWDNTYKNWFKNIKQEEKIYISLPSECSATLFLDDEIIAEEGIGCYELGNAVLSFSSDDSDWKKLILCISGKRNNQEYIIGQITEIERFVSQVTFDYVDGNLFWNKGLGFVGNMKSNLKLRIYTPGGDKEFSLNLEDELITSNPDIPLGEYKYQIIKGSENIFIGEETILSEGYILIGDKNELRFLNSMIEITNITFEENEIQKNVRIKNTYIDSIEFEGVKYVASEERECPVYKGVMFYMGQSLKHHEFSYEEKMSDKGYKLYIVNPVKIIYINEHTLSITNQDEDGLYYYRYFDKRTLSNIYSITDREPTKWNMSSYYLADLYTYKKERMS